jgi:hypothetical protein
MVMGVVASEEKSWEVDMAYTALEVAEQSEEVAESRLDQGT